MYNKNSFSKNMRNPGKAYIKITSDELNDFFSKGLARITKEKCKNFYNLTDFRRCIVIANHLATNDEQHHIVDLMLFALGQLEDMKQTIDDLQYIIKDLENQNIVENTEDTEKIETNIEKETIKNGRKICKDKGESES